MSRLVMSLALAVAAIDTIGEKTELEQRFLDLEVDGYTIERVVEATTARTDCPQACRLS